MNIFVTDYDPYKAAINLDDKRVVHMPRECIEMLSIFIYRQHGYWPVGVPFWNQHIRNVQDLVQHPINNWIAESRENISWLFYHTLYLLDENQHRFEFIETGVLTAFTKLRFILVEHQYIFSNPKPAYFRNSSLYKDDTNVVRAYRRTMEVKWFETDKIRPVTWTRRDPPEWLNSKTGKLF